MFEAERRLIDATREPKPDDIAECSGKYYALAVLLADVLEGFVDTQEAVMLSDTRELHRKGHIDEPC